MRWKRDVLECRNRSKPRWPHGRPPKPILVLGGAQGTTNLITRKVFCKMYERCIADGRDPAVNYLLGSPIDPGPQDPGPGPVANILRNLESKLQPLFAGA